jgi:hypothetical protein
LPGVIGEPVDAGMAQVVVGNHEALSTHLSVFLSGGRLRVSTGHRNAGTAAEPRSA